MYICGGLKLEIFLYAMKKTLNFVVFGLLFAASMVSVGCSETGDEPGNEDLYTWSDIAGVYATKPEKVELMPGQDWATVFTARGLEIKEYVLTDWGVIGNSDFFDNVVESYCQGLSGGWYSDMLEWDIYGLDINGSVVDVLSGGEPTGYTIEVYDDYIVYKGRQYYRSWYFNQHVDEWTKVDGGGSTPPANESVSVSISARTVSSNRFNREYEITVSASGSNFTVQQIGIDRVSGVFYTSPYNTSATSHTFGVSYSYGSSSVVRGMVKTTRGTYYSSNTITLSK